MGATTHKRWRKARVLDVCEVAQHVRQVVLEPETLEAPAPPGSHIDIGVYVNGRADVRSYSVVGMGAYGSELILGVQLARQSRGGSAYMHARPWILGTSIPYPVFLLQATLRNWLIFGLILLVMAVALLWKPDHWSLRALYALPALLAYLVTSVWLAAILAPLCARFRDLYHAIQTAMRLFFFVTPILWMPSMSEVLNQVARWNPMTHYIEIVRDPLLYDRLPTSSWSVVLAINAVGLVAGIAVYASTRNKVAHWV